MSRAEAYLHAKFHLDPSDRLATIHQRRRQGRQTGQTGQRSGSIGRTVLQTVAQTGKVKPKLKLSVRTANCVCISHIVVAGFPNPLPDTLHLLFSWFVCVRVRVWSCVRMLARLRVPVLVALLVALASRSTPVQWFRVHTDCACARYIVL